MKAKIIEKEKEVKFEPFLLELKIDSEQELCDLLHRLNPLAIDINMLSGSGWLKFNAIDTVTDNGTLWGVLYEKATNLNLIK